VGLLALPPQKSGKSSASMIFLPSIVIAACMILSPPGIGMRHISTAPKAFL